MLNQFVIVYQSSTNKHVPGHSLRIHEEVVQLHCVHSLHGEPVLQEVNPLLPRPLIHPPDQRSLPQHDPRQDPDCLNNKELKSSSYEDLNKKEYYNKAHLKIRKMKIRSNNAII